MRAVKPWPAWKAIEKVDGMMIGERTVQASCTGFRGEESRFFVFL